MVDSNGKPVERSEKMVKESRSLFNESRPLLSIPISLQRIRDTYEMRNALRENESMIRNACIMFLENVISRSCGACKFLEWNYNERGTLIKIKYEKYPPWDANESEVEACTEYVSFEELSQYIEEQLNR